MFMVWLNQFSIMKFRDAVGQCCHLTSDQCIRYTNGGMKRSGDQVKYSYRRL